MGRYEQTMGRFEHTMGRFEQKVVLVTGSSSGIGQATARAFDAEGARVVVNSATSVEAGEKVAASLSEGYYVQADIADADACGRLIDKTIERFGRLDVLVNNAGVTKVIAHRDLDAVTELLGNVTGPAVRVNAVAPGLVRTPWTADWGPLHEAMSNAAPLGRSGEPDDIAQAIVDVASNRYMTGQVVVVDGGVSLR